MSNTYAVGRPSAKKWPEMVDVFQHPEFVIKISKVQPLTDSNQVRDMLEVYRGLRQAACNSPRERNLQTHTMTEATVFCPDPEGMTKNLQVSILRTAVFALVIGQNTIGPAAVSGTITHSDTGLVFGNIESRVWDEMPPTKREPWPGVRIYYPIQGNKNQRTLSVRSRGETLDNWDTLWFRYLLGLVALGLRGREAEPAEQLETTMKPQLARVRFLVVSHASVTPSVGDVQDALRLLTVVIKKYGAKEMELNLMTSQHEVLGVGFWDRLSNIQNATAMGNLDSTSEVIISSPGGKNETIATEYDIWLLLSPLSANPNSILEVL